MTQRTLITAGSLWAGRGEHTGGGVHIAIEDGRVVGSGHGDGDGYRTGATEIVDLGQAFVTPALHDNHTFVTGTMLDGRGVDLAGAATLDDAVRRWRSGDHRVGGVSIGRGWRASADTTADRAAFEQATAGVPTIWFGDDPSTAWRNAAARDRFGTGDGFADNESLAPVFRAAAEDAAVVVDTFGRARDRLVAAGVLSVKDVVFDDSLGVLPALAGHDLGIDVTAVVQPVERRVDVAEVVALRERYADDGLRVHGVKLMTDGIVPEGTASLIGGPDAVDWATIEDDAMAVDQAGLALTINADGDAAVRRALDVFAHLRREHGDRPRRWTISDASLVALEDVPRLRDLGVGLEVYLQFLQLFPSEQDAFMDAMLGTRAARFDAFRSFVDGGVAVSAGTDLPLLWPDLPASVVAAVHRRFVDLGPVGGWRAEQALTADQVLTAWTSAPSALLGLAGRPGRIVAGAPADLVAFDVDLVVAEPERVAAARVLRTLRGGVSVHQA